MKATIITTLIRKNRRHLGQSTGWKDVKLTLTFTYWHLNLFFLQGKKTADMAEWTYKS